MAATRTTSRVGLFVELRKRLKTGMLIIGKDLVNDPTEVSVAGGDGSLDISTAHGLLSLALPAGVSLEPGSCVQTAACDEELHFRMRINVDQSTDDEGIGSPIERLQTKDSYCFHCQGCRTRLLDDRVFQRVLPLPNGNWNAIVDDWCCHPDPFANLKLLPRAQDCLLGDTFFLLTRDASCQDTLVEEVTRAGTDASQDPKKSCRRLVSISCQSCSAVLGEALAPDSLKFYITQVVVDLTVGGSQVEATVSRSLFLEQSVAARMLELSNTLSVFHFAIQTPDEKPFLLIWLLNTDSVMVSVAEASVRQVDGSVSPGPEEADGECLSSQARPALKLLWIVCSDEGFAQREIVGSWETNAIGHPLILPLPVCEELLQAMEDTNALLPSVLRHMRSYQVSYLRL
ncbi:E3 ubiquitin-protein ligase E3D [Gadus macrocephalus]|uniref:E3 ubiquitin-protein ligase E3D n=1 Tax=Gadus macrocephalus TaxID=80720 RepID=UPI0028CB87B2|nr:E3 ubiquitin-protein ligase E3D [Gadus macrocephalus]